MNRRTFLQLLPAGVASTTGSAQNVPAALQLLLRSEPTHDGRPRVAVIFHNPGSAPLTLNIGVVLGNGAYATGVQFLLEDSLGKVRRLVKRDPIYVAGSMGPYIVQLAAGGDFTLASVDLIDYWSYEPAIATLHLSAGRYTLVALFQGHDPSEGFVPAPGEPPVQKWPQNFWVGRVQSEPLSVRITSSF